MSTPLVWFVTGTSSGFGEQLVPTILARGDRVVATARSVEKIKHLEANPNCKTLQLDVTDSFENIQKIASEAIALWGRVDVVVNNAGVGSPGISEEAGAKGFMEAYNINFFGTINVTNAFLPSMREAKSGTIVLMGSRHAWKSQFPFIGAYASTKAALHAYGEALSAEVKMFGVRVLIVQPGAHRTNIIANATADPLPTRPLPCYEKLRELATERYRKSMGKQPNDPEKAMKAVVDVVRSEGLATGKPMPLWLVLGKDAEDDLRENFAERTKNLEEYLEVTRSVTAGDGHAVLI